MIKGLIVRGYEETVLRGVGVEVEYFFLFFFNPEPLICEKVSGVRN